jgi:hypothetical protein
MRSYGRAGIVVVVTSSPRGRFLSPLSSSGVFAPSSCSKMSEEKTVGNRIREEGKKKSRSVNIVA